MRPFWPWRPITNWDIRPWAGMWRVWRLIFCAAIIWIYSYCQICPQLLHNKRHLYPLCCLGFAASHSKPSLNAPILSFFFILSLTIFRECSWVFVCKGERGFWDHLDSLDSPHFFISFTGMSLKPFRFAFLLLLYYLLVCLLFPLTLNDDDFDPLSSPLPLCRLLPTEGFPSGGNHHLDFVVVFILFSQLSCFALTLRGCFSM